MTARWWLVVTLVLAACRPTAPGPGARVVDEAEHDGVTVELAVTPVAGAAELFERHDVRVTLRFKDTATGQALTGLDPGAWLDRRPAGELDPSCKEKLQALVGGSLARRATVDLNVYHVLTLNADATISVVDPRFGYGGSKLLALIKLPAPGVDWVLAPDGKRLFVSTPDAGAIAVVDTTAWKVERKVAVGGHATRMALAPDGKYLLATLEPEETLAVVDTASLAVAARHPLGAGPHALTITDDNARAFVTSEAAGRLDVVDLRTLRAHEPLHTGARPVSVAWSAVARAAYVSHAGDGSIAIIDGDGLRVAQRIAAEPGLGALRFTPGGRYALVVNPRTDLVHSIDAATNRIVATGDVSAVMGKEPLEISFTRYLAYIRSRRSETVLMVPIEHLGNPGPMHFADFPAGQEPLGNTRALAATLVPAPEATAVLVANPLDQSIAYYREGMAAPMGTFKNYGREPQAVIVVNRALREERPGVYSTVARLGDHGTYDLAVLVNAPRVVQCFTIDVAMDPALQRRVTPLQLAPVEVPSTLVTGETTSLRVRVTDAATKLPRDGLRDLGVLVVLSPGTWQQRHWAEPRGEGVYQVRFTPPDDGLYQVYFQVPSANVRPQELPRLMLRASSGTVAAAEGEAP